MSETHTDIRDDVREHYSKVAKGGRDCCDSDTSCCSVSEQIGYSKEDLESLPKEAEMGLGCGNPISFAGLKLGEVVLDLGSGGGVDCFLAHRSRSRRAVGSLRPEDTPVKMPGSCCTPKY
jgi:arsenite methyltransferase